MKTSFRYIFFFLCLVLCYACSISELDTSPHPDCIKFVARPISYVGYELGVESTKSFSTSESTQLSTFENKILSAHCLVFGNDGSRIGDIVTLTVTDNIIQPHTLYHNFSKGPLTVCFLANIPGSYVQSIDHIDDFVNVPLENISYSSYQTDNKDVVIVPEIGGNKCLPMFGCITQSYENGVLAGVTKDDNGKHVATVPLLRLFSRVNVKLQVKTSSSVILNRSNFDLTQLTVRNLPTKVRLKEMLAGNESAWVKVQSDFYDPITLNPDIKIENGSLISSPSFDFVCYVPEYCLLPDQAKVAAVNEMSGITEAQKQKYKPNLYDPAKYPVHLNLVGKSSQPNFVDVPLEYNIFLGEDAFDSFSFYRNWQYDNNISINGMGDAILGTDDRVEATYHNLANPDNSGDDVPANCYIISKPGRYMIPTYIGNNVSGGTQIGGASVDAAVHLSGDSATDKVTNIRFLPADHADNTLGQDCIMFDVNMYDSSNAFSPADVVGSNKLICLKNSSGQIIWSWHLWLCEDGNRPDTEGYLNTYPTTGAIVMNRALGATNHQGIEAQGYSLAYWDDGLYYQWGRKDPLLPTGNTTASASTYAKAKQNPRTFYTDWKGTYTAENNTDAVGWTSSKSVNDPCPPGYKVPSTQIWRTENSSTGLETMISSLGISGYPYNLVSNAGIKFNIVYPYSGHIISNNAELHVTDVIETKFKTEEDKVYTLGISLPIIGEVASDRIKDIVLEIKLDSDKGVLWSDTATAFTYEHGHLDIDVTNIGAIADRITIKSCKICHNNYTIGWGGIKNNWETTYTDFPNGPGTRLTDTDKAILFAQLFIGTTAFNKLACDFDDELPVSHGAHVRCVRDQ